MENYEFPKKNNFERFDQKDFSTDFISFSSCTARTTIGPRTAYSTSITRGFKLSIVRHFLFSIFLFDFTQRVFVSKKEEGVKM